MSLKSSDEPSISPGDDSAAGAIRAAGAPSVAALVLDSLFWVYQAAVSPFIGPACRFSPRCSEYGRAAIARYGAIAGARMAVKRILRCHPWHPGGFDPVP